MSEFDTETSVFESSDCATTDKENMDNLGADPMQGQSTDENVNNNYNAGGKVFVPFTAEEENRVMEAAGLPKGIKGILEKATGILYMERYESFVYNNWPYDVRRGHLCHPRALALAGLGFHSVEPTPTAQCQVCLRIFDDLKPNSNPWILHSEACPECYLVTLGQRDEVDDYTMDQVTEMVMRRVIRSAEIKLVEKENNLKKQIHKLMKLEKERKLDKVKTDSKK